MRTQLPALAIGDATITEGDSGTVNATFTVTLTPVSGRSVFVQYATADGSATAGADYDAIASTTLTFLAGETTKTITVPVHGDLLDEIDETFTVNLSGAQFATITDGVGQGTITDDDALPELTVNDVTVTEGDSGSLDANFTVSLTPVSGRQVTVQYATANGSAIAPGDYTATSGSLTFAPGQTTKTVSVPVNGDALDEIDETFNLNLSVPANATILDGVGLGTIVDNDGLPSLSVNDVTVTEGNGGGVNAVFTVSLTSASGQAVQRRLRNRRRHGDRRSRLHRDERQPHLHGRPDDTDDHRPNERRPPRRDRRDVHHRSLEPGQRGDLRPTRPRDDHR